MKGFIKEELGFVALVISWAFVGLFLGPVIYFYLPLSIVIMKVRNQIMHLFLGFCLILVMSDSRNYDMAWAGQLKEFYIIALAAFLFFDRRSFPIANTFYQKFVPFFIVALYCASESNRVGTAFEKTLSYFLLLAVVPNYVSKLYFEEGRRFLRSLIGLISVVLVAGFILYFVSPKSVQLAGRYTGILGNPNGLGIYAMLSFLLFSAIKSIHPDLFTKKEERFFNLLIIATLVFSGARSSIIAVLVFVLFNYFYRMSPLLGFIVFLFIIVSYQLIADNFKTIIIAFGLEKTVRLETIETASGRIIAWNFAWTEIQKNFFFGRGFSYTDYVFEWNFESLNRKGHQGNAHNSYLTLWLETGLVGLVLYFTAIISSFVNSLKRTRVAIPIMYALFFQVFFESWLAASLNPYTIMLVMILVLTSTELANVSLDSKIEEEKIPDFYPERFVPR